MKQNKSIANDDVILGDHQTIPSAPPRSWSKPKIALVVLIVLLLGYYFPFHLQLISLVTQKVLSKQMAGEQATIQQTVPQPDGLNKDWAIPPNFDEKALMGRVRADLKEYYNTPAGRVSLSCSRPDGYILDLITDFDEVKAELIQYAGHEEYHVLSTYKHWTELHRGLQDAALNGQKAKAELLIKHGAWVNRNGNFHEHGTALESAARGGHFETVKLLLENGANPNDYAQGQGRWGGCLRVAAEEGNEAVVRLLLENGAVVKESNSLYGHALETAATGNRIEIVNLLLDRGTYIDLSGQNGTALRAAAANGHRELVELLLRKGAEIDYVVGDGTTNALQGAILGQQHEMIEILLERGADINAPSRTYGSTLQVAARDGYTEVVRLLLELGADPNAGPDGVFGFALHAAANFGHNVTVEFLIEKGADIHAKGGFLGTALEAAARSGHVLIVGRLLDECADINARGNENSTALIAAAGWGRAEIVRLLLDRGADVNAQGGFYGSALTAGAAIGSCREMFDLLLDCGADVNILGGYYGSALQAVIGVDREMEMIESLLDHGADVNHLTCGGEDNELYCGVLQAAAGSYDTEILELIFDNREVDVNAFVPNGTYCSALQVAAFQGYLDVVRFLLDHGAEVNYKQECGGRFKTVLEAATYEENWYGPDQSERDEVARLLMQYGAQ